MFYQMREPRGNMTNKDCLAHGGMDTVVAGMSDGAIFAAKEILDFINGEIE